MNTPDHFETIEDHAVFRPTGEVSLEQGVQLITSAIVYACEQQIKKLMVDITGLTGFNSPNLSERYYFVREWPCRTRVNVCVAHGRQAGGD